MRLTYKIVLEPIDFKSIVMELTVPEGEERDRMALGKRMMTDEEVESKWTREEFIETMSEFGYGSAAECHIKAFGLYEDSDSTNG